MTRPEEHADCVWDEPMPPGDRVTARTFGEAVEHVLEKAYPEKPETVEVAAWRRMEATPDMLTGILDYVLEHLDEEVGDPDGEPTEPTHEMREAERAFIARILELYEPQGAEIAEIVEVDVEEWEAKAEGSP